MRNRTDTRYLYQSFLSKVWSYILYSPYTLPVSFNKDLTVIYSTLLVWKTSQAEKIWWRLYVSFLYYVLLLLLRDCIFQKVNTSEILIIILEKNMIIPNLTNSGISWSMCIHPTGIKEELQSAVFTGQT